MPRVEIDLTGRMFGQWTVICRGKRCINNNRYYWLCRCSCGVQREVIKHSLIGGVSKSCGCTVPERNRLTSMRLRNIDVSRFNNVIHRRYYAKIAYAAIKRKINFNITEKYITDLFIYQNGLCALSGLAIGFGKKLYGKEVTASLDRIDSSIGYIEGNVQWVHKDVNWMKQDYDQNRFFEICCAVANHKSNGICGEALHLQL